MTQSRLLPTVLLAASSWLLISLFGSQQSLGVELGKLAFIKNGVETIANNEACCLVFQLPKESRTSFLTGTSPAASSRQSRTAMRGFKDDFYAWKDSLSKDEQALLLKQAQNEFDKKFRKSDEFSQDLPEEKIQSFAKVLKKFFDNAAWHALNAVRSFNHVQELPLPLPSEEKDDYKKATAGKVGTFLQCF